MFVIYVHHTEILINFILTICIEFVFNVLHKTDDTLICCLAWSSLEIFVIKLCNNIELLFFFFVVANNGFSSKICDFPSQYSENVSLNNNS